MTKQKKEPTLKEIFLARAEEQLEAFLKSNRRLVFPHYLSPEISIIIVTYTQTALELLCLMSILKWATECSYEVIISNNGTSERNARLLGRLENVKIINNKENLGFVKGVNVGAEHAAGDYLLLLNDDALITYECIQKMVERMRGWERNKIGVVGAQIRLLDNTIQDAGGILYSDGTAEEYRKWSNPDAGDVNFVRETDYVSGACFMTPRELFNRLGKFDEVFSPGYCEESDYCIRARKAGYKTVYNPDAHVMHYEWASSGGPDVVSNLVKDHTVILYEKHTDLLAKGYHKSTPLVYARSNKRYRGRVLIIDDFVPRPKHGDDKIIDFIKALVNNDFFVTFFPLYSGVDDWMSAHDWLPDTVEVMLYEDIGSLPKILSDRPRFYDYFISKTYDLSKLIKELNAFDGKYVIQMDEEEDYDSSRITDILKPTALWVDWHIPEYDSNAGDYAVYNYCTMLKELGFKIRYWSNDPDWKNQKVKYIKKIFKEGWELWNSGFTFEQTLADLGHTVDLVILARPDAINYIQSVRDWTKAPIIYYCHDLHYLREMRRKNVESGDWQKDPVGAMRIMKLRDIEHTIIKDTDLLATVSEFEKLEINRELPEANVSVWPWYCPSKSGSSQLKTIKRILFLGGLQHTPNLDAITWFLNDIYPLVKKEWPDVVFNIAGSHIPKEIQDLDDGESIHIAGFVDDLDSYFDSDSIFVAPIRFGAGLKGKIAMALSYGVPVVTTTLGAEGIGLTHGENVLIADTDTDFVREIIRLKESSLLWNRLHGNAVKFAMDHWSAEAVKNHLLEDIRGLNVNI
jgi:GT2 family glycosyltransferase